MSADPQQVSLSEHTRHEIDHWLERFPTERKRSAILGGLRAVQHQNDGYLTSALMDAVADYIGVPPVQVYEVASFYSMFETKPVGRIAISVCNNVSCMLRGSDDITAHLERKL
ncbi:MAG: NAD(P)H-dependent oxidoreductase subunit E, partial [Pseudomonadota bacterium]